MFAGQDSLQTPLLLGLLLLASAVVLFALSRESKRIHLRRRARLKLLAIGVLLAVGMVFILHFTPSIAERSTDAMATALKMTGSSS